MAGVGGAGGEEVIATSQISFGYTPRTEQYDPEWVKVLTGSPQPFPPIVVERDTMTVIDGHHRLMATRQRGEKTIRVSFFEGSPAEALRLAIRINSFHGKPLSAAERRAAAAELLRRQPMASDRSVAESCGISAKTVRVIRERASADRTQSRTRLGRDGRIRPVDPVLARKLIRAHLDEHPGASDRGVARALGVSPHTVKSERLRRAAEAGTTGITSGSDQPSPRRSQVPRGSLGQRLGLTEITPADITRIADEIAFDDALDLAAEARRRGRLWLDLAQMLEERAQTEALRTEPDQDP